MVFHFDIYFITILVCASLSFIGCLLIIICSLVFKSLRSYTFRLITYLAIADLLASTSKSYLGFLIPGYEDESWCIAQALIMNYSQMASLFITGIISFSLYEMIVQNNSKVSENEKIFVSFSFVIPAILTPLPLITDSYGDSSGWCWVKYDRAIDTFWMFFEFYGLLFMMFLLNIFFYYRIYKRLGHDESLSENRELVKKVMSRIKWYPIILVFCFGPSAVHRVYYLLDAEDNILINLVSASLSALYGFVNALVYGMTNKVRTVLGAAVVKWFSPTQSSSKHSKLIR